MSRPDFVYFDLGNVLLFFDHGIAARSMAKVIGVDPEVIKRTVFDSELQIAYERGERTTSQFVSILSDQFGKKLSVDELKEAAADIFVPNMNILPVLERLRSMKIPLGLLSNTCEAHWEWILRMRYPQVLGWFDPIILSYEVQRMKPEPEIYKIAAYRRCIASGLASKSVHQRGSIVRYDPSLGVNDSLRNVILQNISLRNVIFLKRLFFASSVR